MESEKLVRIDKRHDYEKLKELLSNMNKSAKDDPELTNLKENVVKKMFGWYETEDYYQGLLTGIATVLFAGTTLDSAEELDQEMFGSLLMWAIVEKLTSMLKSDETKPTESVFIPD